MTSFESGDAEQLAVSTLGVPGTVLFDDWDIEQGRGTTYLFTDPLDLIVCNAYSQMDAGLEAIARHQEEGRFVAGYISYDAGLGLDKPMCSRHTPKLPLVWMGVYDSCRKLDRAFSHFSESDAVNAISTPRLNISNDEYIDCVRRIKEHIQAGDVYQVNYTCKLLFENAGTAAGLFARLREAHPVCHSAFINTGACQIASLSPELFVRRTGRKLITRPMKGTIHRGLTSEQDNLLAGSLQSDAKNCAENVMILDLMRNDLGRVCEFGSVSAPEVFRIERYRSIMQMTSTAQGTIRSTVNNADLLKAIFPPGSITGAPKLRALELIDGLESEPRGAYCGCMGVFFPGGDFLTNVAIRTIVQQGRSCELGVGSGIVADSEPALELEEVMLKGKFLLSEPVRFDLLETLLYEPDKGYAYLDQHIARMQRSAHYFGYRFDDTMARKALASTADQLEHSASYRVRLLCATNGEMTTECQTIPSPPSAPIELVISDRKTNPQNVFLYHKTTNRAAYDNDAAEARSKGFFDVLYMNERGEITECATTNICVLIEGHWYTPSIECGLLPGVWRGRMIASAGVSERRLTADDLAVADRVIIGNSVRGEIEVSSIETSVGDTVFERGPDKSHQPRS